MKRSKAISAIAAVLAAGFLLASCTPFQSAKQKKWVDEMEDAFPEDTFEYVGHPSSSIVIVDYDRIQVHSKKYKTDGIIVGERDGKLVSNYLAFKYNDELREEWERIFYGRFPCSDYEVSAYSQMNRKELLYPVKDISAEKFIDKYMEYDCFLILYYDDESQIPSENEMKEYILDLVEDEPHPYSISIFYCDSKYDRDEVISNYNVEYRLYMTDDDTIKSLNVSYKGDTSKNHSLI